MLVAGSTTAEVSEIGSFAAKEPDGWMLVIDPGHGGLDAGAVKGEVYEKRLNMEVSLRVKEALRNESVSVRLTRDGDQTLSLQDRVEVANQRLKTILVSIHHNTAPRSEPRGVETYFCPGRPASVMRRQRMELGLEEGEAFEDRRSNFLAEFVQESVSASTGAADRGFKEQSFLVIRQTVGPSVLVECGFLTNEEEFVRLMQPDYQRQLGRGIAEGILRFIEESEEDLQFGLVLPRPEPSIEEDALAQSASAGS